MRIKRFVAVLAVPVIMLVASSPAFARRPGGSSTGGSCVVSNGTVNATGLPTGEVINFLVTDSSGTSGWVLGYTDDGAWSVSVAPANGPTTYQFVSKTWGPNGSKYTVFASCS